MNKNVGCNNKMNKKKRKRMRKRESRREGRSRAKERGMELLLTTLGILPRESSLEKKENEEEEGKKEDEGEKKKENEERKKKMEYVRSGNKCTRGTYVRRLLTELWREKSHWQWKLEQCSKNRAREDEKACK